MFLQLRIITRMLHSFLASYLDVFKNYLLQLSLNVLLEGELFRIISRRYCPYNEMLQNKARSKEKQPGFSSPTNETFNKCKWKPLKNCYVKGSGNLYAKNYESVCIMYTLDC